MKTKMYNYLFFAVSLSIAFVACDFTESEPLNTTPPELSVEAIENAPEVNAMVGEPVTVAIIEKDGYELYFDAFEAEDAEESGIVIRERIPEEANLDQTVLDRYIDQTPFCIFTDLTDQDVPVPEFIAQTTDPETVEASGRRIDPTNRLYVNKERLRDQATTSLRENCYDVGASRFRSRYCNQPTTFPYSHSFFAFCDNGTAIWNQRSSIFGSDLQSVNRVFTWTNVVCGFTDLKYYYHKDGEWRLQYKWVLGKGIWKTYYCHRSSYRWRRVRRDAQSGSYFRAYTQYAKGSGRC